MQYVKLLCYFADIAFVLFRAVFFILLLFVPLDIASLNMLCPICQFLFVVYLHAFKMLCRCHDGEEMEGL